MKVSLFINFIILSFLSRLTSSIKIENEQDLEASFNRIKSHLPFMTSLKLSQKLLAVRSQAKVAMAMRMEIKIVLHVSTVIFQILNVLNFPSVTHSQDIVNVKMDLVALIVRNHYVVP